MKFIAYCTKGLEEIAQKEITQELKGSTILKRSTKRIIFESDLSYEALTSLKTIDDLAIYVDKIDLTKFKTLNSVVEKLSSVNYPEYFEVLKNYRNVKLNQFSITLALLNYKKFQRDELKESLAKRISEKYSCEYLPKDHSNFDIRINIENNIAWIGIKLTTESLYDREYKVKQMMGSLKATIAAAMVALTINSKVTDLKLVDNFCGSGTILCEALLKGYEVFGGDINESAVNTTISNLENLKYDPSEKILVQDATRTLWQNSFFDCAVSNLPWGKQIEIESITSLYEGTIKEYSRIVKSGGTICLILTNPELMKSLALRYIPNAEITEVQVGFLGQRPTILLIQK